MGCRRRVHRDFEPGPYVESLAKLCVVHNLANFPIFPVPPRVRWGRDRALAPEALFFAAKAQSSVRVYPAAVHTQFHAFVPSIQLCTNIRIMTINPEAIGD